MIILAEPVHFGSTHIQINASIISLVSKIYQGEEIEVYAENDHAEQIKMKVGDHNKLSFTTFKKYSEVEHILYWWQKIIGEFIHIIKILRKAKRSNTNLLIWLSLFPTGHFFLTIIKKLFRYRGSEIIILHGELEYLIIKEQKFSNRFLAFTLQKALLRRSPKSFFFVLSSSIYDNLEPLDIKMGDSLKWINHPFLYNYKIPIKTNSTSLRIILFGALKKSKGGHLFFDLASRFSKEISNGDIEFKTIGRIHSDLVPYLNDNVTSYRPNTFIDQNELEENLIENDFAVFFYDENTYKLTASGAAIEALNCGLPFITFKNDYFSSLNKTFKVGKIVESIDEMESYIRRLIFEKSIELENYHKSIFMFVQQNSFLLQADNLKSILINWGIFNSQTKKIND